MLLHKLHDFFKDIRFVLGEVGKDFAIQFYALFLESRDERAVLSAVLPGGGVDAHAPECAVNALFFFAAAKHPRLGVQKRLFGGALFVFTAPAETLGLLQDFGALLIGNCSSFNSWHGFKLYIIGAVSK